jgi:Family of unknown function (DUF6252)
MKTVRILSLTLFVSLLVFSCKKDDDGGDDGNAASGTITAKVNGANFSSNTSFTVANKVTAGGITTVTIQGSDNQGKGVLLIINGFEGTGSYNIGGGANVFVTGSYIEANANNPQASQTWMAPFDASVAGEINISEDSSTKIKGTFNFNAKNSNDNSMRNITEGNFNVNF